MTLRNSTGGDGREPSPFHRWVQAVSPEQATQWLDTMVTQRTARKYAVAQYARDMASGKWMLNGDAIRFNQDGELIDGQHRLMAVASAGIFVRLEVCSLVPREAIGTIDRGRGRTPGDILKYKGVANYTTVAGAARWYWLYENRQMLNRASISEAERDEVLQRHPLIERAAAEIVAGRRFLRRLTSPSALSFVYAAALERHPLLAEEFITRLNDGVAAATDDPAHALRERLIAIRQAKNKPAPEEVVAILVKAWNAFRQGRGIRKGMLRWRSEGPMAEAFPTIL